MRFKIDCAILIVGSKFTILALFYFVFEGNFPSTSPRGAYIWRGDLTEGFLRYKFGGLIFGGACTWRGLFSEFYGILQKTVVGCPWLNNVKFRKRRVLTFLRFCGNNVQSRSFSKHFSKSTCNLCIRAAMTLRKFQKSRRCVD